MPAVANVILGTIGWNDSDDPDGFSESYWLRTSVMADAKTKLKAIYLARRKMMCDDIRVQFLRVSDPNIRGDSLIDKPFEDQKTPPNYNTYQTVSPKPNSLPDGLVIFADVRTANALIRAQRPLHAIPTPMLSFQQQAFAGSRDVFSSSAWEAGFDAWAKALIANASIVHRTASYTNVIAAGTLTPRYSVITDITPTAIAVGDYAVAVGIPKGTRVVAIGASTVTLTAAATTPSIQQTLITFKRLTGYTYAGEAITSVSHAKKFAYRRTGRPFGSLQGRRRRR